MMDCSIDAVDGAVVMLTNEAKTRTTTMLMTTTLAAATKV